MLPPSASCLFGGQFKFATVVAMTLSISSRGFGRSANQRRILDRMFNIADGRDRLACEKHAFDSIGQSRHFRCVPVASGLHPTPDMALHRNNRRYVPFPD